MSNTLKIALSGAAALAVAVVGIGLYLNQPDGVAPPAPSPSPSPSATAVEIAEAYIAARNAYDPERARELLADNFLTNEPPDGFRDLSSLELAFENHRAWGFQHSLGDCRASDQAASPDVAVVECDSLWTTEVHLRGDYPPTPETFRFRISDGRIASVTHSASDYDWYFGPRSFYEGFLSGHLEFRALVDRNHNLEPEATREVIERLPEYFDLYEEWLKGSDSSNGAAPLPPDSGIGEFQPGTHAMSTPREAHTATLLSDGRVLLTGGSTEIWSLVLDSAETFDHSNGDFTPTGSMIAARAEHTATLLADGRVLVTGGFARPGALPRASTSAEIYDPGSGTFSPAGSMGDSRRRHTATLLADGRVLIAGGPWHTAEIFDPASGTFAPTGAMSVGRQRHTATLLADGRVLIAGGWGYASADVYDPASGTFSATGSMASPRGGHGAVLLPDGRVLVVGGCSMAQGFVCGDFPDALATAEIYDPATGTFAPTGPLTHGRHMPSATLLADGRILVAGGMVLSGAWPHTAEIYDPTAGTFALAASMGARRISHTATRLPDGRVVIAGGESTAQSTLESVELYTP